MPKSFEMMLGIAALVVSVNLSAQESVPGLALAETHAYAQPLVSHTTLTPTQDGVDSQNSPDSTDGAPNAWLYALGFLGLVVVRRTRSGPMA